MGFRRTSYGDIYVVSARMGGYRGGAIAAEITVQTLQERLAGLSPNAADFPQCVREAFARPYGGLPASPARRSRHARHGRHRRRALVICDSRMLVGHVGDSRASCGAAAETAAT
jgi:protein phosphatase